MANKEQIIIDPLYDVTTTLASNPIYSKCYTTDSTDYRGASNTKVIWDGNFISNKITHSPTTDNTKFFVEEHGQYYISSILTLKATSTGVRDSLYCTFVINGVQQTETFYPYLRNAAGIFKASVTLSTLVVLDANSYIEISLTDYSGTSVVTLTPNESNIVIQKLGGENVNEDNVITISDVISVSYADSPYVASYGQDIEIDCTNGQVEVELPTALSNNGKSINISKVDSSVNKVVVNPYSTETINGNTTKEILYQWTSYSFKSNGSNITIR